METQAQHDARRRLEMLQSFLDGGRRDGLRGKAMAVEPEDRRQFAQWYRRGYKEGNRTRIKKANALFPEFVCLG
jgi:hypothetical protein